MARRRSNTKNYHPIEEFRTKFEESVLELTAAFLKSDKFKHGLTKGEEREKPIRDFFLENLPKNFDILKGEVIDVRGNQSSQLDIMIYDKLKNIRFYHGESSILPVEALLASIEIKSLLTRNELKKSLKAVKTLKNLKPFGYDSDKVKKGRAIEDKVKCRFFHSIFAYKTDLKKDNWAQNEFKRIKEVSQELDISYKLIDRIYVVDNGIINCNDDRGINEQESSSLTLMYYYMHQLQFLLRENKRRDIAPYSTYSGQMTKGWEFL